MRIGYDDARFPGYSWRGYGSFSQLQDEVLLDIPVTSPSDYRLVYRYHNPNPTAVVGEVTVMPASDPASDGGGEAAGVTPATGGQPQTHKVLFQPTSASGPAFITVSGEKNIYPVPFDLSPGRWQVNVTKLK